MDRSRRAAAFTLVEMLVVTGIVGIMAGLLLPVLNAARAAARDARCTANLSNIGKAVLLFAHRHDGFLPPCGPDGAPPGKHPDAWYRSLLPYLDTWDIYVCPSKYTSAEDIPEKGPPPAGTQPSYRSVHYGMNIPPSVEHYSNGAPNAVRIEMIHMGSVISPSQLLYIADGAIPARPGAPDANSEDPASVKDGGIYFPDDKGSLPAGKHTISARHGGNAICAFLDGHVERMNAKAILAQKRKAGDCIYTWHLE